MTTFDSLAEHYDAGRLGYSNDLYNALLGFGLAPRHHVLDVACGTGLASRPLVENGFKVTGVDVSEPMLAKARARFPDASWVAGSAEALPFAPATFDAAISAQAFHHLDRTKAMAELMRVVKPGGLIAIWWKLLMNDDPVAMLRGQVARELSVELPQSGLAGGFKEFYAAPLADHALRVLPWRATIALDDYLRYERSRKLVRDAFGARADEYFARLEERLREQAGAGNPLLPLGYLQFLYVARNR
jgi:ubiquinone/menaquinone biosynthesis C-methylase UbiE